MTEKDRSIMEEERTRRRRRAEDVSSAPPEQRRRKPAPGKASTRAAIGTGVAVGALGLIGGGLTTEQAARPGEGPRTPSPMPAPEAEPSDVVTWDLTVSDHERVGFFVEYLMGKNYDKTRLWLERTGRFAPMIQKRLRDRGMPEDLLYLTMIESGLDPNAYSRAHAAGLWQFIPETGRRYGLEVSEWVDERRDPIGSTLAALDYLGEMYERFGSWYLAAAGYNTGENRVGRIMREVTGSERGADERYWEIWDRLPRETRDYVPLMLAAGHIAKEPQKYGFDGIEPQQPLEFEEVVVPGGTRLAEVARAAHVDADVVRELNPHYVKGQTPPNRSMPVRVPLGSTGAVLANLGAPATPGTTYLAD